MGSGVAHYFKVLSPSNVNSFLEWRSMWFLTKIMKKSLLESPDMMRGKAVEEAITHHLTGAMALDEAKQFVVERYKEYTQQLDVEESEEKGIWLPEMVELGTEILKPYGKLEAVQRKLWVKSIPETVLPWMGYADLVFEGGLVVDLKVTGKTPSGLSGSHARQGAFYTLIPGATRVDFVYLVQLSKGPKAKIITLENAEAHLEDLRQGAMAMHKTLSISDEPEDLKHIFHPCPGDWWLKDEFAFNTANEVWKFGQYQGKAA